MWSRFLIPWSNVFFFNLPRGFQSYIRRVQAVGSLYSYLHQTAQVQCALWIPLIRMAVQEAFSIGRVLSFSSENDKWPEVFCLPLIQFLGLLQNSLKFLVLWVAPMKRLRFFWCVVLYNRTFNHCSKFINSRKIKLKLLKPGITFWDSSQRYWVKKPQVKPQCSF